MNGLDTAPLLLSLRLAAVSTAALVVVGTPLAWWLARSRGMLRSTVEAVVGLPLVLPPTVLGFYLLGALAPRGPVGSVWQALGGPALVFSFTGLVIGSIVYSLPFVVRPLQTAFESVDETTLEAAATLGAGPIDRFVSIVVPLARRGFVTAATLGFAHTLGEFGVVLMIGGNIPGETRVASIAIYDHVENLQYGQAHALSAIMLTLSFVTLLLVSLVNRGSRPGAIG